MLCSKEAEVRKLTKDENNIVRDLMGIYDYSPDALRKFAESIIPEPEIEKLNRTNDENTLFEEYLASICWIYLFLIRRTSTTK